MYSLIYVCILLFTIYPFYSSILRQIKTGELETTLGQSLYISLIVLSQLPFMNRLDSLAHYEVSMNRKQTLRDPQHREIKNRPSNSYILNYLSF